MRDLENSILGDIQVSSGGVVSQFNLHWHWFEQEVGPQTSVSPLQLKLLYDSLANDSSKLT